MRIKKEPCVVIPAKAGIQVVNPLLNVMFETWTPAFAGVTTFSDPRDRLRTALGVNFFGSCSWKLGRLYQVRQSQARRNVRPVRVPPHEPLRIESGHLLTLRPY